MRTSSTVTLLMVLFGFAPIVAWQAGHAKDGHQHADAAKLKNPVPADAASIEAGKKTYAAQCVDCHGEAGKGDGPMAAYTGEPAPSNLADADWKHGPSDGEIYTVIHNGVDGTGMKDFGKDLKANEIWQVVNYIRTLGPGRQ